MHTCMRVHIVVKHRALGFHVMQLEWFTSYSVLSVSSHMYEHVTHRYMQVHYLIQLGLFEDQKGVSPCVCTFLCAFANMYLGTLVNTYLRIFCNY